MHRLRREEALAIRHVGPETVVRVLFAMEARISGMPPSTDGGDDGPGLAGAAQQRLVAPELMGLLLYDHVPVQGN